MNILAALLPTGRIHENLIESIKVFREEGNGSQSITGNEATLADNHTDAWMLLIADYNGIGIIPER